MGIVCRVGFVGIGLSRRRLDCCVLGVGTRGMGFFLFKID